MCDLLNLIVHFNDLGVNMAYSTILLPQIMKGYNSSSIAEDDWDLINDTDSNLTNPFFIKELTIGQDEASWIGN